MAIHVTIDGESLPISDKVFEALFDHSVAGTYRGYEHARASGRISFAELSKLAQRGEIPLPLFFAPVDFVQAQIREKNRKLLTGISKTTFSIGSRQKVELRDVELILKDLIHKQEVLKRHDRSLTKNAIVGMLYKSSAPPSADADKLLAALGLTWEALEHCKRREQMLNLLIASLESRQVLVSRSVRNYMPQRLTHVKFSGMTIRDSKVPIIFLAGGDHGDHQEPVGRTIFTLTLLAVLVARRVFAPVTWDAESHESQLGQEYEIAASILMPNERFRDFQPSSLEDMRATADEFLVTPSAATVRAMRLGIIDKHTALSHLAQFREEFIRQPERKGMKQILPENGVRKYAGRELSHRMLEVLDSGNISMHEFRRTVCLNKLRPDQIDDLRRAIR